MKKALYFLSIFLIAISCSAPRQTISVIPLKADTMLPEESGIIYFLPKAVIKVEMEITTTSFTPGPFHQYSNKFLSIPNAPSQRWSESDITDISFSKHFAPDPNAAYMIMNATSNSFYFSDNSILLSVNTPPADIHTPAYGFNRLIPEYFEPEVIFSDMTIEENFTSILDTTYKVIEIDSVLQKIPVYNSVMTLKGNEQKAEEAAEYILELRKARFTIMEGDLDYLPEEGTIKQMLAKIDEMEEKYLELFLGRRQTITNKITFYYTPDNAKKQDTVSMFYLCDEFGLSNTQTGDEIPVYLKIKSQNTTDNLSSFLNIRPQNNDNNGHKDGLFYRIPSQAKLGIYLDEELYATKNVIVPQFGSTAQISRTILENENIKIKLHPQFGSILQIN